MSEINVLNKETALKQFFITYEGIEGALPTMDRVSLLEYLGNLHGEDKADPNSYSANDVFVSVASAATGIPEHDFLVYALQYFGHEKA